MMEYRRVVACCLWFFASLVRLPFSRYDPTEILVRP